VILARQLLGLLGALPGFRSGRLVMFAPREILQIPASKKRACAHTNWGKLTDPNEIRLGSG
jgi:hypothetical protein